VAVGRCFYETLATVRSSRLSATNCRNNILQNSAAGLVDRPPPERRTNVYDRPARAKYC
jgi:hypothetical protein